MNATSKHIQRAIDSAPAGTSGLVIEPWSKGEIYGVAANWGQAAAPIYSYGSESGWGESGRQVADARHDPSDALRYELYLAIIASGGNPDTASDDAEDMARNADDF